MGSWNFRISGRPTLEEHFFSRRVKKRRLHCRNSYLFSLVLHCRFHLERGSGLCVFALDGGQTDVFFQTRRPRACRRLSDLKIVLVKRNTASPSGCWDMRRKSDLLIELFVMAPIDLYSSNLTWRILAVRMAQLLATDEKILRKIHRPAQTNLERRVFLRLNERLFRADIVDFEQNETRFEPSDIERKHSRCFKAVWLAFIGKDVPYTLCISGRQPYFISEVTGVTGAGNGDRNRSEERRVGKECRSRWAP